MFILHVEDLTQGDSTYHGPFPTWNEAYEFAIKFAEEVRGDDEACAIDSDSEVVYIHEATEGGEMLKTFTVCALDAPKAA